MLEFFQNEEMMNAMLIALGLGLVLGYFLRAESVKRKPIHGGMGAEFFHYLGCVTLSALIPYVFIGIFMGVFILRLMAGGIFLSLTTFLLMILHALFESQAAYVEVTPQRELD